MVRYLLLVLLAPILTACLAQDPRLPSFAAWGFGDASTYHFNWRLAGDQAVAPLQVFNSAHEIWLQFAPGQVIPALFARTTDGERPLAYTRRDPYLVLAGQWQTLVLRGGKLTACVEKVLGPASSVAPSARASTGTVPC